VGATLLLGTLALLARERWPGTTLVLRPDPDDPEAQRTRELEQLREVLVRRTYRRHRVASSLLAGRLSLLEAAGYFRALAQGPPAFDWERFRERWPSASDAERHCHEVIGYVCSEEDVETRARLRAELAEHLRRGPLRLPQPARPLEDLDHDAD
jgi:hypothetical protein